MVALLSILIGLAIAGGLFYAAFRSVAEEETKAPNPHIKCQHCESVGTVQVFTAQRKDGISGGKAAGAVVTGGASLLATGLSGSKQVRHLRCQKCGMEWDVA